MKIDYGMTRSQLIEAFDDFSEQRKMHLLSEKWDLVRGREMLPHLLRILDQAEPDLTPALMDTQMVWMGSGPYHNSRCTDLRNWLQSKVWHKAAAENDA